MVVERMLEQQNPVAYFYCSRDTPERRDPVQILRALVAQLSIWNDNDGLPTVIVSTYKQREREGFSLGDLTFDECCALMVSLSSTRPGTTIIIDALDETEPEVQVDLTNALQSISDSSTAVKMMISSRYTPKISHNLQHVPHIHISTTDNVEDIRYFIERGIGQAIAKGQLLPGTRNKKLKREIISVLNSKAQGMFVHLSHAFSAHQSHASRRPD